MDDDQTESPVYDAPQVDPVPPSPDLMSRRETGGDGG